MLASITPLGERGRGRRWPRTTTAYATASTGGGALAGGLAGTVGAAAMGQWRAPTVALIAAAVVCLVSAAIDLAGRTLPGPRRQVDETWLLRYRGWVYGAGFGFQLGLGVVTVVTTAAVYAVITLAVLTGSPLGGASVGAAFGVARALPLLATAPVDTPARLRAMHRQLDDWRPRAHHAAVITQAALALGALVWVAR